MHLFATEKVTKENVSTVYGAISPTVYNEFLETIDFQDPYHLTEIIADGPREHGSKYGLLNLSRDSAVFDMAFGCGKMGELLHAKGFTHIEGADATASYVRHVLEQGWYSEAYELYLGVPPIREDLQGRFDVVVGCGVFYEGHIPAAGF